MSDKKQIIINTKDFQISNKTRKKRPSDKKEGIKIRQAPKKAKDTLKKRSILRMIRQHQHEKHKDMFQKNKKEDISKTESDSFLNEFEKSKQYFENLAKETTNKNNSTLKNYHTTQSPILFTNENVHMNYPVENINVIPITNNDTVSIRTASHKPMYSSMKYGSMPTYRSWTKTQKNLTLSPVNVHNQISPQITQVHAITPELAHVIPKIQPISEIIPLIQNKDVIENANKINEIKQTMDRLNTIKQNNNYKNMKRKKISRRTYKVGKSKIFPRISVLISNRTIRNNITTKKQLLQQAPLIDVRKFLIKKGLIKIGSSAPNDVLRKMYEDVTLICGDVQNHNPDNLLYNYINGGNE